MLDVDDDGLGGERDPSDGALWTRFRPKRLGGLL